MKKSYAALQLLSLGPLSLKEFIETTGWPSRSCSKVLYRLVKDEEVAHVNIQGKRHYMRVSER